MATLTDRPPQKSPAQPNPAKPSSAALGPDWRGAPGRPPERNRRREQALACLYLFGPVVALILGTLAVIATALAMALGGSGVAPPATGAAELVPGNALLYLHVSTDPSRPAVRQALTLTKKLPGSPLLFAAVTARLDAMLAGRGGNGVNFAADVRPWLGDEAGLAVLDTAGASAGSLIVLDVRAQARARRFLAQAGARPDGAYRGVPLLVGPSGAELAFIRHYLVLGQAASVQAALDVARGQVPSLASGSGYRATVSAEPAGRVLDAYASADGIRRALVPRSGLLGELGALVDQPTLSATAMSLSAATGRLTVDVHSTLTPKLASQPAYRPVQFKPTLGGVLPAGSMLLLDARGLRSSTPRLLSLAARAGIATRIGPLLSRLGSALAAQGANLSQVLGIFRGETAIAVAPGRNGSGPVPVVVTRTPHPDRARAVLAALEGPLTQVFAPPGNGPGQVPVARDATVAGAPVRELSLAPGFRLDYGVAHGLVVLSTGPAGIAGVFAHARALGDAPSFQSTLGDHPSEITSLVFFDLSQLLRLGNRSGLIESTQPATLWPAVEKIHAVGLTSWRGADDTTTKLQLQIP